MKHSNKFVSSLTFFLICVVLFSSVSPLYVNSASENLLEESNTSDNAHIENDISPYIEAKDPEVLQQELDNLTYEVESLRDENIKHFRLSDGTYQAVVYGDSVHRMNSKGEWEEIDNSLSDTNGYMATKNARVKFAKAITGNESIYTLHEGNYKITLSLNGAIKKTTGVVTNHCAEDESMTQLQKLQTVDHISSTILYENILDGIDIEYVIISNDIKENIIVKECSDTYNYVFTLSLNGLTAKLHDNEIILSDTNTEEIVGTIPAPYMYDAAGEYSNNVSCTLTDLNNGKYELTVSADNTWINDTDREFPVVIDPTLIDIAQQNDTYVNNNQPTKTYGQEHKLFVSNIETAYYQFTTPSLPDGVHITSASVRIPYYYLVVNNLAISVGIYQVTSSWSEYGMTWNNKPTTASSPLDTESLYANGAIESAPAYATFIVTNYVKSWYADTATPNYGFALKRTGGDNSSVIFIAREKMQKYGQLTINYSESKLPQGVYAVGRSDSHTYFKAFRPTNLGYLDQDSASYSSPPLSSSNLQNLFKFIYIPDYDAYFIVSMLDNSLFIYPSMANNAPIIGRIDTSDYGTVINCLWNIEYTNEVCYISHTRNNTTYYIRSQSTTNNARIVLTTNKNDSGTRWKLSQYTGNVIEKIFMESYSTNIYVGDTIQYRAYMTSSRMNHLSTISYSVSNAETNSTATNRATIDSQTGLLRAYVPGDIKIRVTYQGAPWIWVYTVTILKLPCSGYEEQYNPSAWNIGNVQPYSNCYNYALNKKININDYPSESDMQADKFCYMKIGNHIDETICEYSLPTGSSVYKMEYKSYEEIVSIVLREMDELGNGSIGKNDVCPVGTYKVALVLDLTDDPSIDDDRKPIEINTPVGKQWVPVDIPDYDFHWYRQNSDGTWSHKRGGTQVINQDASGQLIYDPQICDRTYDNGTDYDVFVGYFYVYSLD